MQYFLLIRNSIENVVLVSLPMQYILGQFYALSVSYRRNIHGFHKTVIALDNANVQLVL